MKKLILLFLPVALLLSACTDQAETDAELITDYIAANNLDAKSTDEGIFYVLEKEGTGTRPIVTDEVEVHYEGYLLDGSVFDSSYDRNKTATFPLYGVIKGWQIGIPLMKEGGKIKLIIPSELGYGGVRQGTIPANSVLVFDVELIDVR